MLGKTDALYAFAGHGRTAMCAASQASSPDKTDPGTMTGTKVLTAYVNFAQAAPAIN
jgi:hypothetical protein